MKKVWGKNQIIITSLALLIAIAGYFSFASRENADAVDADGKKKEVVKMGEEMSEPLNDIIPSGSLDDADDMKPDEDLDMASSEAPNFEDVGDVLLTKENAVETASANVISEASLDFLASAKLNREQMRAKEKEAILSIIDNESLSEDAKSEAVAKMLTLTDRMEKELLTQQQLGAKGYLDAIVSISDQSVDVVVGNSNLTDAQKAQIEDVVMRKTGCDMHDIVITTMH